MLLIINEMKVHTMDLYTKKMKVGKCLGQLLPNLNGLYNKGQKLCVVIFTKEFVKK